MPIEFGSSLGRVAALIEHKGLNTFDGKRLIPRFASAAAVLGTSY